MFGCSVAVQRMLRAGRGGSIVNIASIQGTHAFPRYYVYAAAKAAVIMATKSIALDYATAGIRANAVLPGCIETPMTYTTLPPELDREEALRREGELLADAARRTAERGRRARRVPALGARLVHHRHGDGRRRRGDHARLRVSTARSLKENRWDASRGKRALVTGASSGIGREVARRFAREGASVACGGRDPERTERTVDEIAAAGGTAFAAVGDVSTPEGAAAVVAARRGGARRPRHARLERGHRRHRVAGRRRLGRRRVRPHPRARNLRGPFLVARAAIPHMLEAGGGSIVHMSSVCAITVWAGDCAYDVSKAGLNMLSDHIAVEYGARGIRSNTLMPGVIRTELHESVMEAMQDGRAFERELLGRHPIGRFGKVEESPTPASSCARTRPAS